MPLDLQKSHGWYDFTVKAEGIESAARFAGHVETGRSSFTDPLMGRVNCPHQDISRSPSLES